MKKSNQKNKDVFKSTFSKFNEMKKEQIAKVVGGGNGTTDPDLNPDGTIRQKSHSNTTS